MKTPTPTPTPNKIRGITEIGPNDFALILIVKDNKLRLMPLNRNRVIPQEKLIQVVTDLFRELTSKA